MPFGYNGLGTQEPNDTERVTFGSVVGEERATVPPTITWAAFDIVKAVSNVIVSAFQLLGNLVNCPGIQSTGRIRIPGRAKAQQEWQSLHR